MTLAKHTIKHHRSAHHNANEKRINPMAMATATDAEHLRASGFKRILVRLDEATRRKYCCRALEEDLQRVLGQAGACEAAMKQAQQVQDATRRLEAGPRTAAVSAGILDELDALLGKLSQATSNLGGQGPAVKQEQGGEDQDQARTLVKHILQDQDAEKASAQVKRLEKLMPVLQDRDDKQVKWWRKHVQKAVDHAVTLALQDGEQGEHAKLRLSRTVKKVAVKCPDLQDWSRYVCRTEVIFYGDIRTERRLSLLSLQYCGEEAERYTREEEREGSRRSCAGCQEQEEACNPATGGRRVGQDGDFASHEEANDGEGQAGRVSGQAAGLAAPLFEGDAHAA
jgi:hypothetical protein